ncbi:MAG: redox-regulated ATPase YchF [Thermoprotei archaeon]|nr:MAG: redox-regulated ATPase YchF [Thermoprotei archaeon]
MLIGVIGKTNVGKSTFFAAATLATVEIANHPFTTIKPNIGVGYVRKKCVCKEFGVKDNPRNSICIDGERFIPVTLIDVAGLIPEAHKGRGLGNKFLDDLRKADVLLHVVDASGSTDAEGRPVPPGTFDPVEEVRLIQREVDLWLFQILQKDWRRLVHKAESEGKFKDLLAERLAGLSITKTHVVKALRDAKLESTKPSSWRSEELMLFVSTLRKIAKPSVIVANKADISEAQDIIKKMTKELKDEIVVPTSALAELVLRRAAKKGYIKYLPGDPDFEVVDESKLTPKERKGLEYIREHVLRKWGSTGVQQALNKAAFEVLEMIAVYPVEDPVKLTDHEGRVLPDVFLVKKGTTARELAYKIHTDLGRTFLYAIDARSKRRLGENYVLQDNDVISIVAAKGR